MVGEGGWCRVDLDDPALSVMVRLTQAATGRISIAELAIARFPGVTADTLRAVPIGRVEAWANGPGREDVLIALRDRGSLSESEVGTIDKIRRAEADLRARWGTSPEAQAAQNELYALLGDMGVAEQVATGELAFGFTDGKLVVLGPVVPVGLRSRVRNLLLEVPEGQPKPDSFYREVARLYSEVALNSPRPAAVLAEANSVPVSTVHGWVKEARRRGLLAPGERQVRRKR